MRYSNLTQILMRTLFYILLLAYTGITAIQAGEIHSDHSHHSDHQDPSSKWMLGYQLGYSHIASNNDHMSDDSGMSLGLHAMKPIKADRFKDRLFIAAGIHTTFTEEKHVGAMIGIMYQINENTMLSVMPGIMWMKHSTNHSNMDMKMGMGMKMVQEKSKWESEYGTHIEINHKIRLFNHLLNPSIGWMSSDSHDQYTFGLNFHF